MATRTSETKMSGAGLVLSALAAHYPATASLKGGPADVEVTFTMAGSEAVSERTVRTDANGDAILEFVPQLAGSMAVTVTQPAVNVIAAAEGDVSGSPPADNPETGGQTDG
jgi:hypothetical protein